jgi:phosphoglycolate phosphatase-like HAD superfamily hydrolase
VTDAIIVDMDGTLCDVSSVRHYVTGESRNFRAFHEASRFCPPHPVVDAIVRTAAGVGIAVVIVTARDARFEQATRDFLVRNGVPFDALFMRPWGDTRRDSVVKDEIHAAIIGAGFRPLFAVDDREDIAAVWRAHGIPTILVPSDDAPG